MITRNRLQANQAQKSTVLADHRTVTEVVLEPEPGFGDPGPIDPVVIVAMGRLERGHHAPGCAFGAGVAHGHEPLVHDIGSDLARRLLHPVGDLVGEGIALGRPFDAFIELVAPGSSLHVAGHGVVVDAGQLGGGTQGSGEVIRLEYLHLLLLVQHGVFLPGSMGALQLHRCQGGTDQGVDGDFDVRPWGDPMSVPGEIR
jgi:hypothetical protein